jgi:Holliday junction resolvase RusA-like endonuclease
MTWSIELDRLPAGLNGRGGLLRMHWTKREELQRIWNALVSWAVSSAPPAPRPPVRLVYVRKYARQPMDLDNAASSLKQPLDALVRCGALPDDGPQVVVELVTRQEKVGKVADQGIRIELHPIQ